ncbi:MAG: aminoglycoside phosphotransferase family protein [Micromonosporaceae bacterium]|nr:aminoglycoside phosphotransferase family protein [Micromonosporaceae bacterium]
MAVSIQDHTGRWLSHFTRAGYPDAQPLAAGVEGAVYRLGGGMIGKVWERRRVPELLAMQGFYADVASAGVPFATPVVVAVEEVDGTAVSYERELAGEPLQRRLSADDRALDPAAIDCLVAVLRALAGVAGTENMRRLAVLDEQQPFWAGAADFSSALVALLLRRAARFGDLLRSHVPDFDDRLGELAQRLTRLPPVAPTVLHGDLFGPNILVDEAARPTAVLDFGFLTTAGDPRFDAAISAAVMNMYGPHAAQITGQLTRRLADELGYPVEVLVLYRAAYAVATSNAFTSDGSDGHFAWCVAQLASPEVSDVLRRRPSP